jgi:hypothetical protein
MKRTVIGTLCSTIVVFVLTIVFPRVDLAAKDSAPEHAAKQQAESAGITSEKHAFFVEGYSDAYVSNLVSKEKRPVYVPYVGDDGKAWLAGYTQGMKDSDSSPQFAMSDFGYSSYVGSGTFVASFSEMAFFPGKRMKQLDPKKYIEMWWFSNPSNLPIRNQCYYEVEGWLTAVGRHGRSNKYPRAVIVTKIQKEECR